jgi:hypothetical protein
VNLSILFVLPAPGRGGPVGLVALQQSALELFTIALRLRRSQTRPVGFVDGIRLTRQGGFILYIFGLRSNAHRAVRGGSLRGRRGVQQRRHRVNGWQCGREQKRNGELQRHVHWGDLLVSYPRARDAPIVSPRCQSTLINQIICPTCGHSDRLWLSE